jgi:hypothetical protein
MGPERRLCDALLAKVHEQIEKTAHLIRLVPPEHAAWRPPVGDGWPLNVLLGHLLECAAGFCAVLAAAAPERLAHFAELRKLPVNHACPPGDAIPRLELYRAHIDEGFAALDDARLAEPLPTIFVAHGEPLLTLLLGNLEHWINHKHQLFTYLQQMGVTVKTGDLYRFRGLE